MTCPSKDKDILARTLYGEARGLYHKQDGGLGALISVGNVVMNRVKAQTWFGKSVQDVCLKPYQFSCWNPNDPNRPVIESVTSSQSVFKICLEVAEHILSGRYPDLTKGSDHYYAQWLQPGPSWAKSQMPRIKISDHLFFRLHQGS
jgi:N-acetylmuramoyl-L-alanine amidase